MIAYLLEYNRYLNIIGIILIAGIALLFSKNRSAINIRLVFSALAVHVLFASILLNTRWGQLIVGFIAAGAEKVYVFADKGIEFMFGKLSDAQLPWGFIFAIKVLPVIIFVGALTALLFHWGVIQRLVYGLNVIIRPLLGASGIETMSAIANSILGQTEAALFMGNYIHIMTRSELFVLMTSGMSAISLSVLVIYTVLGISGAHALAASVMSIPASIFIAKIILPETEPSVFSSNPHIKFEAHATNSFDAISKGTMDGLKLAVSVAAMLISFLSLVAMGDYFLGLLSVGLNYAFNLNLPEWNLALLVSYLFLPFTYLLGLEGAELWTGSKLLGIKFSLNELVAFAQLVKETVSARTFIILTYALCGFANISCIGIQIGMIGALAPERRHTMTQLGLYALLGSSLANILSALVVSLLI